MAKRTPYAVYRLNDAGRDVALVRYDGDPDIFTALAADWVRSEDYDRPIEPPQPRLYRMNACQSDDYAWTLGHPKKRGPGVFLGALVTLSRRPEPLGEVAPHGCWRWQCEAKWGERHLLSCPNNQPRTVTAPNSGDQR